MGNSKPKLSLIILGWIAIALFIVIYGVELLPHHGAPVTVQWIRQTFGQAGLIVINILMVISFLALLPYRRSTRKLWKSKGAFIAFVIALMTEMFGWPLLILVLSPLIEIPVLAPEYFHSIGHWPATIGTWFSILGVTLIAFGWISIHSTDGLVTSGLYKYMRHPQYTGIILFTFGWILHWPSVFTLLLWPLLIAAYVWLAKKEEQQALEEFGSAYEEYAKRTKRFIPFLV